MTDHDLAYMSALDLAQRIKKGDLSSVEVVANSLSRIDDVNGELNCFCFVYNQQALEQAHKADEAIAAGDAIGPLHGVPIAIKDFTPVAGRLTTRGSKIHEKWVPEVEPPLVARLSAAGAILVGKTTTPEFAYSGFTRSRLWGKTSNPWNTKHSPGGSSGGSAAAVAAGCVPLAEGSDAGGSIRIPGAMCGVVGLKPSLGRIPVGILPTAFDSLFHFGPLARTVSDAALFLQVCQGPDACDPLSQPAPENLAIPVPTSVKGLRIAFTVDMGFYVIDPEVEANTRSMATALRGLGAQVDEIELGWDSDIIDAWNTHWSVLLAVCCEGYLHQWRSQMDPTLVELIESGLTMSAIEYKRTEVVRTQAWNRLARVLSSYDVLICPTTATAAPLNTANDIDFHWQDAAGYHGVYMTQPFNFFGQCPVISIPSGYTAAGLPTGLQVVGQRFDDATVLKIAAALELDRPWAARRPPL